jgi:HD superfamily phosphodiesterase
MTQGIDPVHAELWQDIAPFWSPNEVMGHGRDHALRAYSIARRICAEEHLDFQPVGASVLIMDAGLELTHGRAEHIRRGLDLAETILPRFPEFEEQGKLIRSGIEHHEADNELPQRVPSEVLAVRDADTLDRLGYSGIRMTIQYGVWKSRELYCVADPGCQERRPSLDEYTFDYIRHLYSLVPRLSLAASFRLATQKTQELDIFWRKALETIRVNGTISVQQSMEVASVA